MYFLFVILSVTAVLMLSFQLLEAMVDRPLPHSLLMGKFGPEILPEEVQQPVPSSPT